MTTTAKTGMILVIILAIIVIGWVWYNSSEVPKLTDIEPIVNSNDVTPSPSPIPNTAGTGMAPITDTSTSAIQDDISAFEKQMEALITDTTNIDQGMSIVVN